MRTQVAIIGAGPAGLMLSHLLYQQDIESVVLEIRSREYVEQRVRAGVLEQGTVDLIEAAGLGERMRREGHVHRGIELRFGGRGHRMDFPALTGGRAITIYAQQEIIKDLVRARLAAGGRILFDVADVSVHDFDSSEPCVRFRSGGKRVELKCRMIAGCDGFHGVCRAALPAGALATFERTYPFAWLGILADSPPPADELIYASHERGFALFSMRSPAISRCYLQVAPDEDLANWPDERIWRELRARLDADDERPLRAGPVLEKIFAPMRSFVAEPMQHGRLFLAGDAAHVVPPTGAKGLNLALADVRVLARAAADYFRSGREHLLQTYSQTCLKRVWRAEHFSWWMTSLLHRFPDQDGFRQRLQRAQLDYLVRSPTARAGFAENYVGLPFDFWEQSA
jgi:p-hydroxybenzoate 3-monooxygenase